MKWQHPAPDTSPGGVFGLPKSASPYALCSLSPPVYSTLAPRLVSLSAPIAPLHLHLLLRLCLCLRLRLRLHLTVPPCTVASLASPSTTIPSLAAPAPTSFSLVNQTVRNIWILSLFYSNLYTTTKYECVSMAMLVSSFSWCRNMHHTVGFI